MPSFQSTLTGAHSSLYTFCARSSENVSTLLFFFIISPYLGVVGLEDCDSAHLPTSALLRVSAIIPHIAACTYKSNTFVFYCLAFSLLLISPTPLFLPSSHQLRDVLRQFEPGQTSFMHLVVTGGAFERTVAMRQQQGHGKSKSSRISPFFLPSSSLLPLPFAMTQSCRTSTRTPTTPCCPLRSFPPPPSPHFHSLILWVFFVFADMSTM